MIKELNRESILDNFDSNIIYIEEIHDEFQNNPFGKYLLYIENGKVIGYLYYSDIYDRLEINQIEIENIHRKCGKATMLMNFLIEKEKKNITLEVNKENIAAINLYKKFNFEEVAIREKYYNGIDGLLMERKEDSY